MDWPPPLRRLLLIYSANPRGEAVRGPAPSTTGATLAVGGGLALFGLILGAVFLYHRLRFPELDAPISLVPRGGDIWARAAAASVYVAMVAFAWLLARRGGPGASRRLGAALPSGLGRTLWIGTRLFLVLFLVLLCGRWLLRSVEVVETRLDVRAGADVGEEPTATAAANVREAVAGVVDRAPRGAAISLWVVVVALLLGPLCEEVFFRGLLFGALRKRWPFWAAALLSSGLFALAHWLGAGWGAATLVLLFEVGAGGLAAAYAYEKTGSLLAPICLHMLWNAATTLVGMLPA